MQPVAKTGGGNAAAAADDPANANVLAGFVDHLLTPGSALSSSMQMAFNVIMVILFTIWGMFLATMPDSVHVWVFGVLIIGLTLSTNWFLNEVIRMKTEGVDEQTTAVEDKKTTTDANSSSSAAAAAALLPATEANGQDEALVAEDAKVPAAPAAHNNDDGAGEDTMRQRKQAVESQKKEEEVAAEQTSPPKRPVNRGKRARED